MMKFPSFLGHLAGNTAFTMKNETGTLWARPCELAEQTPFMTLVLRKNALRV
jgi:hypothetical protein